MIMIGLHASREQGETLVPTQPHPESHPHHCKTSQGRALWQNNIESVKNDDLDVQSCQVHVKKRGKSRSIIEQVNSLR